MEIAKTGLGSSAALTTSLVSALLQWFEVIRVGLRPDSEDRRVVHNLAQLVHANAQGKIGSGFDVAAAVYGTQSAQSFFTIWKAVSFVFAISNLFSCVPLLCAV